MRSITYFTIIAVIIIGSIAPSVPVFAEQLESSAEEGALEAVEVETLPESDNSETHEAVELEVAGLTSVQAEDISSALSIQGGGAPLSIPAAEVAEELPVEDGTPLKPLLITEIQNAGADEYIEIHNPNDSDIILDSSWSIVSVNESGGNLRILFKFSGQRIVANGFFVIAGQYDVAAQSTDFDALFSENSSKGVLVNTAGAVTLLFGEKEIDKVGWGASAKVFEGAPTKAASNLQRCAIDSVVIDTDSNSSDFLAGRGTTVKTVFACPLSPLINKCEGLRLSEIGANLASDKQFIELYNEKETPLNLKDCQLRTNRSQTKAIVFADENLPAHAYKMITIAGSGLTVTKTTTGTIYLLDSASNEIESVEYDGLPVDTSYSFIEGAWQVSYLPTPLLANQLMKYPPCDEGYYRNETTGRCNKGAILTATLQTCDPGEYRSPETGRCRKIIVEAAKAPCKEGQYRSEETGRCRSILATVASTLKPCDEGQFRNPETGRCKKIASTDDTLQPCHEGYERNSTTNRCRKVAVLATSIPEVPFAVQSVKDGAKAFTAWWALGGIGTLALAYGAWEWHEEMRRGIVKVMRYRSGQAK